MYATCCTTYTETGGCLACVGHTAGGRRGGLAVGPDPGPGGGLQEGAPGSGGGAAHAASSAGRPGTRPLHQEPRQPLAGTGQLKRRGAVGVDFGNLVMFSFLFSPSDILEVDMCFQEQQHKSLFFFSPFFGGWGGGEWRWEVCSFVH